MLDQLHRMAVRFNTEITNVPIPDKPTLLSAERMDFRMGHLEEELDEIREAFSAEPSKHHATEGVTDGLLDLIYVALGTLLEMGITPGAAFEEVHAANMRRVRGPSGHRKDSMHDAVKPAGWTPPDIARYLSVTRAEVEYLESVRTDPDLYKAGDVETLELRNGLTIHFVGAPTVEKLTTTTTTAESDAAIVRDAVSYTAQKIRKSFHVPARQLGKSEAQAAIRMLKGCDLKSLSEQFRPPVKDAWDKINPYIGDTPKPPIEFDEWPEGVEKPKILVMGYGRHGKDTVADIICNQYGLTFSSSSQFCAERVILPIVDDSEKCNELFQHLASEKRTDLCIQAGHIQRKCRHTNRDVYASRLFDTRSSHRAFWFDAISAFCYEDPAALGAAIFKENDVYCGIRSKREFHAVRNSRLADLIVWVDRSDHLPPEAESSCTVEPWMADCHIDNNLDLPALKRETLRLFDGFIADWFGY